MNFYLKFKDIQGACEPCNSSNPAWVKEESENNQEKKPN